MVKIPSSVTGDPIKGLQRISAGKVRDIHLLPGHPGMLLSVVTDRVSIFDFVLAFYVWQKSEVLNALNIFWRQKIIGDFCPHDLMSYGAGIDQHLPSALRDNPDLQKRATVIRKLKLLPIENIVRGYLTGNGWKSYLKDGTVGGHKLPVGLQDGSQLPFPIYTPSTKAEGGHDIYLTADRVVSEHGFGKERRVLQIYQLGRAYALQRGIILADTKFEGDGVTLADEVFTPDSSRYWDLAAWEKAVKVGKLPPSLDKEYVRNWGKSVGIDQLDPENPEHLEKVAHLVAPNDVLRMTNSIYRYIFWRLTGMKLEKFQRDDMGIAVQPEEVKVDIVVGSRSDLDQLRPAIEYLDGQGVKHRVHIISCHRNVDVLNHYAMMAKPSVTPDVIIAGAGMAAALPGVLKSLLGHYENSMIPVIGVAMRGTSAEADMAAKLSIEQLPGQPVELGPNGRAYFGPEGMLAACQAAVEHEFLPRANEAKPAEFDIKL